VQKLSAENPEFFTRSIQNYMYLRHAVLSQKIKIFNAFFLSFKTLNLKQRHQKLSISLTQFVHILFRFVWKFLLILLFAGKLNIYFWFLQVLGGLLSLGDISYGTWYLPAHITVS
jgi:hypothetical protein